MGYTIAVGDAYMNYNKEDMRIHIDIKKVENSNAPDDDGHYNDIRPQFDVWLNFCKFMNLEEYFYGDSSRKDGVYDELFYNRFKREESFIGHCDHRERVTLITQLDVDYIDETFLNFRDAYPTSIPKFTEDESKPYWRDEEQPITMDVINAHHVRLLWLGFWFKWAIKNCEHPAVYMA